MNKREAADMEEMIKRIDEMLKIRKTMISRQEELGMWETDRGSTILIYSSARFVELAEFLKKDIHTRIYHGDRFSFPVRLAFKYMGAVFATNMTIEEYEKLSVKYDILKENVEIEEDEA